MENENACRVMGEKYFWWMGSVSWLWQGKIHRRFFWKQRFYQRFCWYFILFFILQVAKKDGSLYPTTKYKFHFILFFSSFCFYKEVYMLRFRFLLHHSKFLLLLLSFYFVFLYWIYFLCFNFLFGFSTTSSIWYTVLEDS